MPGDFSFNGSVMPLCEVGMGDPRAAEPSSWLDISCYVHEAELFRGRERFNDRFEPGTASITFKNTNGWADLTGDSTAVVDRPLRPGRQIRVGVIGPWDGVTSTTRWLWRGFIDQAVPDYDPVEEDVVTVNCVDAFGEAGMTQLLPGPLVGVHETVDARINRVLDAVEWWSAKRSVAAGTALLQGTTMTGRASDSMTLAADSAGGVVFGDVDGNVVYRDLDWMLYDPDVPPDGEIGNCDPSVNPVPPLPPYFDPDVDVITVIDHPPPHPEITTFCLNAEEFQNGGRIIEQGEAYTLYVALGRDGVQHLYLTENGHTFELRVFEPDPDEDGKTCYTVRHPPGGCTGSGCRPSSCEGVDCIPPITPNSIEVPPEELWNVEFLGYSDGGLDDGPQSSVAVSGLNPGAGVMLVVLIDAICNDIPVGGGTLRPTPIAGGSITGAAGMSFVEVGYAVSGGNGAESFAYVTRTPRTDPGTFSVTVDWANANQSRYHIVTVWKLTHERGSLYDDMAAGRFLRAFTWDRTTGTLPSPNPPGKGEQLIDLVDPSSDTPPYPSPRGDVVIAQSLAESPNPPFGASFDDGDGPWWTPKFAGAAGPATRALPRAAGTMWTDSLASGGAWHLDTAMVDNFEYEKVFPNFPGHMEGVHDGTFFVSTGDHVYSTCTRNDPAEGVAQFVEASLTNLWQHVDPSGSEVDTNLTGEISFVTHYNPTTGTAHVCEFAWSNWVYPAVPVRQELKIIVRTWDPSAGGWQSDGGLFDPFGFPMTGGGDYLMRFELDTSIAYPENNCRVFLNGALVVEHSLTSFGDAEGDHQGLQLHWDTQFGGLPPIAGITSPRISGASGGWIESNAEAGGAFNICDNFERADGPLGDSWPQPTSPPQIFYSTLSPATISTGDVIGTVHQTSWHYYKDPLPGDHWIELEIASWDGTAGPLGGDACGIDVILGLVAPDDFDGFRLEFRVGGTGEGGNIAVGPPLSMALGGHIDPAFTFKLRVERHGNHFAWLVDGIPAGEYTDDDITPDGNYIGFGLGPGAASPHILSVCVGSGMMCDTFDRPDGPLTAPEYPALPAPLPSRTWVPFSVVDGHLEWVGVAGASPPAPVGSTQIGASPISGGQVVEIKVSALDAPVSCAFELLAHVQDTTDLHCVGVLFQFDDANLGTTTQAYGFVDDFSTTDVYWGEYFTTAPGHYEAEYTLRLEAEDSGRCRAYLNGELLFEGNAVFAPGPFTGITAQRNQPSDTRPWIESICHGDESAMIGGGIERKCSWIAGYRPELPAIPPPDHTVPYVAWTEVNLGPDDIQSSQCAVTVSGLFPDTFGWRVLANYASGPTPPTLVPPMTRTSNVRYQRNSMIVVFIAGFNAADITAGFTVSSSAGLAFTAAVLSKPSTTSHGQGAIFTAITPSDLVASDTISVGWGASLEGASYNIMEVSNGGSVGAIGAAAAGNHTLGSADGALSAPLSATTIDSSVVFGFLGVLSEPTGVGGTPGTGFIQEIEYFPAVPNDHTYFLVESNPGAPVSAVTVNDIIDFSPGSPRASDAILLGIEITPGDDFTDWELTSGSPTSIGGTQNSYGGPIYSAKQTNSDGSVVYWDFRAGDHV